MKGEGEKNDALPKTNPTDEMENEKEPKEKNSDKTQSSVPLPFTSVVSFFLHALSVGAEVGIHICLGYISKQKKHIIYYLSIYSNSRDDRFPPSPPLMRARARDRHKTKLN